jgi:hypothetical protein
MKRDKFRGACFLNPQSAFRIPQSEIPQSLLCHPSVFHLNNAVGEALGQLPVVRHH